MTRTLAARQTLLEAVLWDDIDANHVLLVDMLIAAVQADTREQIWPSTERCDITTSPQGDGDRGEE